MFEGDQSVIGWGLKAIAAYVYTHIMKAATYSVGLCMYFVYISAYHIHILPKHLAPQLLGGGSSLKAYRSLRLWLRQIVVGSLDK